MDTLFFSGDNQKLLNRVSRRFFAFIIGFVQDDCGHDAGDYDCYSQTSPGGDLLQRSFFDPLFQSRDFFLGLFQFDDGPKVPIFPGLELFFTAQILFLGTVLLGRFHALFSGIHFGLHQTDFLSRCFNFTHDDSSFEVLG